MQDVLLNHLDINIVEAEKRINGPLTLKEYYSVYLIETKYYDMMVLNILYIQFLPDLQSNRQELECAVR